MSIHKYGRKPERPLRKTQPSTVQWFPNMAVKYNPEKMTPVTWKIYSQENIRIQAHAVKIIKLGFGVAMSKGMLLVSLKQDIKYKRCSLQNEAVLESVDDIIITVQNNSDDSVSINAGDVLGFIHYIPS